MLLLTPNPPSCLSERSRKNWVMLKYISHLLFSAKILLSLKGTWGKRNLSLRQKSVLFVFSLCQWSQKDWCLPRRASSLSRLRQKAEGTPKIFRKCRLKEHCTSGFGKWEVEPVTQGESSLSSPTAPLTVWNITVAIKKKNHIYNLASIGRLVLVISTQSLLPHHLCKETGSRNSASCSVPPGVRSDWIANRSGYWNRWDGSWPQGVWTWLYFNWTVTMCKSRILLAHEPQSAKAESDLPFGGQKLFNFFI